MKDWLWTELLLLGVLGVGLVIMGCSGAGVPATQVRGVSLQTLAQDNLSAVLLVRSWFNMLHTKSPGLGVASVRPCAECAPVDNTEFFPDGSSRSRGTLSDCGQYDYTQTADGAGEGSVHWPDGRRQEVTWSAPEFEGDVMSQEMTTAFGDGTRFAYKMIIDWSLWTAPTTWEGTATLADGRSMRFTLNREQGGDDFLRLLLPDGGLLEVRVPLTSVYGAVFWPIFDKGARGTYAGPGGATYGFVMEGDPATDRWTQWTLTAPDGTTGNFTFGSGLDAGGQLRQGSAVVGTLRWDNSLQGTLDLLGAAAEAVGPSRAARDFAVDRWFSNAAALGPAPMY